MLLSLPALLLGAALRAPAPAPPTTATLSGHLAHAPAGDTVRLAYGPHQGRQQLRAVLSPTGDFRVTVPDLQAGTPVDFYYARQHASLYLRPGDDVRLTLDFPTFDESLRFSGRGADASNYLAQSQWRFDFGPAAAPLTQTTAPLTLAQARRQADAKRQARRDFLATYAKAHPLPADFRRAELLDIDLNWAIDLLEAPGRYLGLAQREASVPATYFDFLRQLPLKTFDQYLGERGGKGNTAVMRFLTSYANRLNPGGLLTADPAEAPRHYALAQADFGANPASIDRAMAQFYLWKLDSSLDGVVAAYPTFRAHNRDSTAARTLRVLLARQLAVREAMPAPAFALLDHTGRKVSLQDLRGQVVYLDFWGTWCKPCMQEMPASIALKKQFEGRDVAFVFISVGDKEEKWQQVLAAEHLTSPNSTHLRSPAGDDVPSRYQVTGYPTYWLIGRDGRIITRTAPRPSAGPEAVAALNAALAR